MQSDNISKDSTNVACESNNGHRLLLFGIGITVANL
jgi:hypothetical protein